MTGHLVFILNSILLGVGLAMDAFSVSLANGLVEPEMSKKKMCGISGVFSIFQCLMPMIGWICVHTVVRYFNALERWIPWIALILLLFIGGKMVHVGIRNREDDAVITEIGITSLLVQGIATSIDALSAGFALAEYVFLMALASVVIIGVVTFAICFCGLIIGKRFGVRLAGGASIFGGIILMCIGVEIVLGSIL